MSIKPYTFQNFLDGQIFLFNKPIGWSSFDVVKKIRTLILKKYNQKKIKIGHAGTLDPLASRGVYNSILSFDFNYYGLSMSGLICSSFHHSYFLLSI